MTAKSYISRLLSTLGYSQIDSRHGFLQKSTIIISIIIVSTILISLLSSLTPFIYADNINPGVFSRDSSPYGTPYGEWLSKWWQWNMQIPIADHPRDNYSPQKCTVSQNGSVWFLPDILSGKEERTCTIPSGRAILVPLLTGEYHNDQTSFSLQGLSIVSLNH